MRVQRMLRDLLRGFFIPPEDLPGYPPEGTGLDYERLLADIQRDHDRLADAQGAPADRRVPAIARLAEARLAHCLLDDDYLRRLRGLYLRRGS